MFFFSFCGRSVLAQFGGQTIEIRALARSDHCNYAFFDRQTFRFQVRALVCPSDFFYRSRSSGGATSTCLAIYHLADEGSANSIAVRRLVHLHLYAIDWQSLIEVGGHLEEVAVFFLNEHIAQ